MTQVVEHEEQGTGELPRVTAGPDVVSGGAYVANDGKSIVLARGWARFPLRVALVRPGDDLAALAAATVGRFFAETSTGPAVDDAAPWHLYVSEKVLAVSQGRVYRVDEVRAGRWARHLQRFVSRTPHGIGLGHPATMELAIREAGLPRILLAAAAGALGKVVGRSGDFYRVAGPAVRAIDGPTPYSAYPANVSAKLAPLDPAGAAATISATVRAALPADAARRFAGTVVIDANDLGRNVLGHDTRSPEADLVAAFADNPLGQGRELTPFAVVLPWTGSQLRF